MGEASASVPRFRVLGPTEAHGRHGEVDLGAPQQRCVLTLLLLEAGRIVPLERLIDAVWPCSPPVTARKAIQVYVSHLRRALSAVPDVELVTVRPGYRLDVDPAEVDVHQFRHLVDCARNAPVERAAWLLGEALELWRGPAIADISNDTVRDLLVAGLDEQRLIAVEERVVAHLCLGRAQHVVTELAEYVVVNPLRERGHWLLMRALFSCGRRAEALAAYQNARTALAERLGTEPGPELRVLHEQMLHGRLDADAGFAVADLSSRHEPRGVVDQPFGRVLSPRGGPSVARLGLSDGR